jgi:hypothetical protein
VRECVEREKERERERARERERECEREYREVALQLTMSSSTAKGTLRLSTGGGQEESLSPEGAVVGAKLTPEGG